MKSVLINTADCKATAKNGTLQLYVVMQSTCTCKVFPIDASINIVMKIEVVLAAS